ncbi:cellulase family glycosylhydrolase [Marinimicrobium sp. ABcell2]|uniref:cellulase family glycosylhydrolase n=1 Tax=Marinimicrobium sp. ABcell2 TaxID=3069751 RepID=UPI0027B63CF8|nr:cellulase family glycosylhydrolase [Marinimicrobium sp. ABcell2]MDQ2077046.1 cellulase family glycosylhydrolase [Marinimicrobium sp. ABcell2]
MCGFLQEDGVTIGIQNSRIEAEDFDGCSGSYSTNADNGGGGYRDAGVNISADEANSNGYFVNQLEAGDYLEYSVNVARSGHYGLAYRVLPSESGAGYRLSVDGRVLSNSQVSVAAGDSSDWRYVHTSGIYLSDGPQILRLEITGGVSALDYVDFAYDEALVLEPHSTVQAMGIGINLGNTLDAPSEGAWASPAQKHHLEDFREAGFLHVRIPVTWGNHISNSEPYKVTDERMDRTEEVVDWALEQGYFVILNAHHESWLKDNYTSANRDRFDALWTQVATRFQDKSARLIFEILNEPVGMTASQVNSLNARVLEIIRASNPERLVVIAGEDYSGIATLDTLAVPDDDFLIGNFHSYDPWEFAGQCTRRWGSQQDIDELTAIYQRAANWSEDKGIPLMVNEFGAAKYDFTAPDNVCNHQDRLDYLHHHVTLAIGHGIAASFWDDGGSFSSYDREARTWGDEKDVLVAPNP